MIPTLLDRYLKTDKGRKIIACSMINPIKLCQPIYKNGIVYYRINGKLLNPEEVKVWENEQQKIYKKQTMEKYNLVEEDFQLSEEKIKQIECDESIGMIRNISLMGSDDSELDGLKKAVLKNSKKHTNI